MASYVTQVKAAISEAHAEEGLSKVNGQESEVLKKDIQDALSDSVSSSLRLKGTAAPCV